VNNKAVTLVLPLMLLSGVGWAATLLSQDFSGGWSTQVPPAGWTIYYAPPEDANDWRNNSEVAEILGYVDEDYQSEDILMSPVIDCRLYDDISLCFGVDIDLLYIPPPGYYSAVVQGSTDGGSTWFEIFNYTFNDPRSGTEVFYISGWASGCSQVRLRWYGYGYPHYLDHWQIDDVLVTGDSTTSLDAASVLLPSEFALSVVPNPTKIGTAIRYAVPTATKVSLKLYDITGALARTVIDGRVQPRRYTANLSAKGLARGVYILKLKSDACSVTRKVVIE